VKDFRPPLRAEQEYARVLWEGLRRVVEESNRRGIPVMLLNSAEFLTRYAAQAATRMITGLLFGNARTWREAAAEAGQGRRIYQALHRDMAGPLGYRVRQLIREQADLISSFPNSIARRAVAAEAAAQYTEGGRAEPLARTLTTLARPRARLIARTQISKASTALTRARSEELSIPAYVWETSQDARVRDSHKLLQGVIVFWQDAPSPEALAHIHSSLGHYHAGDAPNDRCYPAPLMTLDQVRWPHKVYWGNKIQMMTRVTFQQLYARRVAA
jgi:Phage Mu protein F like protein